MKKQLKDLNLADDFLFSKVMNDENICKEFLEKLLNIKIEKINILENEKTINILKESKGIRLDVYLKDEYNTVHNIEMQKIEKPNLAKRLRYYQGNMDLDIITKGEDYTELTKTYIIFICTFDTFNKGMHRYTFQTVCIEDNDVKLKDDIYKIILNTKGIKADISEELIEFLNYIEDSNEQVARESKGLLVKHVHDKVTKVKNDISMEVEFVKLLERDKENLEEGIKIGETRGIQIGETRGIQTEKIETVIRLHNLGLTIKQIAQGAGITIEQANDILKNNEN